MSGITTGVGIFSGIDTASLISQLISIEARPRAAAQIRLTQLQSQQAAILDINSRLLSLGTAAKKFRIDKTFGASKAASSNGAILSATAGANATLGTFNFVVNRLVSTHQQISRGFSDTTSSGVGATEFTFEVGGGRVDSSTKLSELNGGLGVDRGKISITDADGATATVDLSTASTVDDVLQAINSASGVNVTASADGYGFRIDNVQSISNVFGSETASSLGIAKTAVGNVITGNQILSLSEDTPLSLLNDGNGVWFQQLAGNVDIGGLTGDFTLKVGGGAEHAIYLGELRKNVVDPDTSEVTGTTVHRNAAATLGDLFEIIAEDTGGAVTASIAAGGTSIQLDAADAITVSPTTSRPTARHLGLLGQPAATTITSTRLIAGLNSSLVSNLNGGAGLSATDLSLTTRDGSVFNLALDSDASLNDLIKSISDNTGGAVTASLNKVGNGLKLVDNTAGAGAFTIAGGAADDLNLAGAFTSGVADSGNLQSRYVTEATLLSALNGGKGVGTGEFTIVNSTGASHTVKVTNDDKTVFDVIRKINSNGINARINDTGDGILIEDTAGGALALTISDKSGRVARDFNLVGEGDPNGDNTIDGSYERSVEFNETDTLQQIIDKVNSAGAGVRASIINDGFGANPYRLIFTSETSGSIGRTTIDTGDFDLGLTQLSKAQDSVVFFGSTNPADAILLTSSSNTLDQVIQGVTIDLNGTSTEPIELNITRDTAAIEATINEFVEAYNGVLERLTFHGRFNQETNERGVLLGDGLLQNIQRTLLNTIQGEGQNVQSDFRFVFEAGLRIGDGGKLEFDAERFRAAYEDDPEGIAELFSGFKQETPKPIEIAPGATVANTEEVFSKLGVLEVLARVTNGLTDSIDGVLTRRKTTFDSQIKLQRDRIANFDIQLDQKRVRLEQQFFAMEQALAQLQTQQSAIGSLAASFTG